MKNEKKGKDIKERKIQRLVNLKGVSFVSRGNDFEEDSNRIAVVLNLIFWWNIIFVQGHRATANCIQDDDITCNNSYITLTAIQQVSEFSESRTLKLLKS